jgi:ATP adenylyltransferase
MRRFHRLMRCSDHLHLIPRSKPAFPLDGSDQPVELNSLGYAGMMLVRSEEEEKTLLQAVEGKGGLMHMLETCGVPREWGEKALESMSAHLGLNEIH